MSKRVSRIISAAVTLPLLPALLSGCAAEDGSSENYKGRNSIRHYENTIANETSDNEYQEADDTAKSELTLENDEPELTNEEYKFVLENGFKDPITEPLSTFSADVDTASFSNARRLLEDGYTVPEDAVRIEEFINYFDYDYAEPDDGKVFSEYVELADCPWNNKSKLMMIGVQGKRMEEEQLPPSNLVFLIDSSGSMSDYNKLPLVQSAFSMLAENLTANDRISIVTYAGSSRTVIAGAEGSEKDNILEALYSINASGGTNGEGGIETAYELAEKYFIEGGNNRIILATDGDLNIGRSSESELTELIEKKRDKGIYLSVLGFGTGNYKDNKLEALADNGNGNYSYIDSIEEARRVLVDEMGGTLFTIAKDVKIQVEFNPSQIKSYRLVGYDNRAMEAEDFYDDSKDAGEVGAGHSVTALYEIELADTSDTYHGVELEFADEHKKAAAQIKDDSRKELIKFSLAYKDVDTDEVIYSSNLYGMEKYNVTPTQNALLAGAVTEFAMLLKNSEYKGNSSYDYIIETANKIDFDGKKASELADLAELARALYRR